MSRFSYFAVSALLILGAWIAAVVASAPDARRVAPDDSKDGILEALTKDQQGRARTVNFNDPYEGLCPQFTSFVYSSGNRFLFVTPNFSLDNAIAGAQIADDGSTKFTFENPACRYVLFLKKFLIKDRIETLIPPRVERHANPIIEIIKQARASQIHRDQGSVTLTDAIFDSDVSRKEFSGIVYFAPKSARFLITDAPGYKIASSEEIADRSYEISISGPGSRLSFSLQKEVLGDGWKPVFGN